MPLKMPSLFDHPRKFLKKDKSFKAAFAFYWFGITSTLSVVVLSFLVFTLLNPETLAKVKYNIYAGKPLVLGTYSSDVLQGDARGEAIDKVFEKYKCPMKGLGKKFVEEADKNDIPFWVVASIAFQESSCGKMTPKKGGQETYNAYGYGVWGNNVTAFTSWEHGIEVMSRYMKKTFYSKGEQDLCEIMKTYTPPSQGSWCNGVGFFQNEIENYKSN